MDANFTAVPILDYSLALSPSTKPLFIEQLRNAAINVGFLYLSNTPVDGNLTEELINFIPKTFGLPQEEKEKIRMRNSPHFLGYSKFGAELTKGKVDMREQFDIATKHECRWKEGDPDYKRLWGPSQVYTYLECCLQQSDFGASGRKRLIFQDFGVPLSSTWSRFMLWLTHLLLSFLKLLDWVQMGCPSSTTHRNSCNIGARSCSILWSMSVHRPIRVLGLTMMPDLSQSCASPFLWCL